MSQDLKSPKALTLTHFIPNKPCASFLAEGGSQLRSCCWPQQHGEPAGLVWPLSSCSTCRDQSREEGSHPPHPLGARRNALSLCCRPPGARPAPLCLVSSRASPPLPGPGGFFPVFPCCNLTFCLSRNGHVLGTGTTGGYQPPYTTGALLQTPPRPPTQLLSPGHISPPGSRRGHETFILTTL